MSIYVAYKFMLNYIENTIHMFFLFLIFKRMEEFTDSYIYWPTIIPLASHAWAWHLKNSKGAAPSQTFNSSFLILHHLPLLRSMLLCWGHQRATKRGRRWARITPRWGGWPSWIPFTAPWPEALLRISSILTWTLFGLGHLLLPKPQPWSTRALARRVSGQTQAQHRGRRAEGRERCTTFQRILRCSWLHFPFERNFSGGNSVVNSRGEALGNFPRQESIEEELISFK